MANLKNIITIIGFSFFVCANAVGKEQCTTVFSEAKNIITKNEIVDNADEYTKNLIDLTKSIVSSTEQYLNSCISLKQPFNGQNKDLLSMPKLLQLGCSKRRTATQFLNIEGNGNPGLILHTVLRGCEEEHSYYDSGFSAIFLFDKKTALWKGYPLWPSALLESTALKDWQLDYPQYHPNIYLLPFVDMKGSKYIAIESSFMGGDHSSKQLSVIRWLGNSHKTIIDLELSDWCGQPNSWVYAQDGKIVVPEAQATDRCEKRKNVVYFLESL